ncbi:hypothetical protein CW368_01230 [Actinomycetales bacterium SN12]|nr:hypothetical protein CW368_01230 [Actinomycetales bacterium SN12]
MTPTHTFRHTVAMLKARELLVLTLVTSGILVFSGCSASVKDDFADLRKPHTRQDKLPALDEDPSETIDFSTARYLGEHEGTSLWIAEGIKASSVCLVALFGDSEGSISCGGTSGVATQGQAGSFAVIPDNGFVPDNAMKISENVYAITP